MTREAAILARLEHAAIGPATPAGATTLAAALAAHDHAARVDAAELARLRPWIAALGAVAEALAHAHARGVVHRDVHPGKVWLTGSGAVLAGWELAKLSAGDEAVENPVEQAVVSAGPNDAGLARSGAAMGTLGYMPPEQADGVPVNPRADAFALGAVLTHVLCGRAPIAGPDLVAATLQCRVALPAVLRPGLPEPLTSLAARALSAERAARPDAAELAAGLAAWLDGPPGPTGLVRRLLGR